MKRAASLCFLAASLVASPLQAQTRFFGVEVSDAHGIEAFEVVVDGGVEHVCRPAPSTSLCEDMTSAERAGLALEITRRTAPEAIDVTYTENGATRTMTLAAGLPFAGAITSAVMTQCFLAELDDGVPPPECSSRLRLTRAIASASRLSAALVGERSPFVTTEQSSPITESTDDATANAIALAVLEALQHPRSTTSESLARRLTQGDLRRRDGATGMPDPLGARREALRAAWIDEATHDHECDSTCGGCVRLSDRGFRLEQRGVDTVLDAFAAQLDDALWAREISIWTLTAAELTTLTAAVARGEVEVACALSDWVHASFRRCAERTLRAQASSAAAALAR